MINYDDLLVEGNVLSIATNIDSKTAVIKLMTTKGNEFNLCAKQIDMFYANDMCLANIIESITVYDHTDLDNLEIKKNIFELMYGNKVKNISDIHNKKLTEKLQEIETKKLKLLLLDAVYGVDISILAADIYLEAL